MSINQFGQYTGNHKTWDHVGNILPNVEHSEGVRPAIEYRPADWLPVQFLDKHYENYFVIMPGKVVAADGNGHLVPAGLKVAVDLAASGDVVTYTTRDVDAGVTNVATGLPVTLAELTDSGPTRGYTAAEIDAAGFLGQSGVSLTISSPLGVAPYAYLQWAGGDGFNPASYRNHNYNMQHQVAILCDYVLELPLVPAQATAEALTFNAAVANVSAANAVSNLPVATNTVRTPLTFAGGSSATLFVNQKALLADLAATGDWHINLETGVVSVWAAVAPTAITLSYSHYAASPASVSSFASAVGDLKAGDLLTFDANSNLRLATAASLYIGDTSGGDESANIVRAQGLIVGQVLDRDVGPKDLLDRVRTSYNPAIGTDATGAKPGYLGQLDQMPGSATGGARGNVHYAGAADTVVRVNLTRF
jgi:hypothetical protein